MISPSPTNIMSQLSLSKVSLAIGLVSVAACAHSTPMSSTASPQQMGGISISPPSPDPRVGLKAGLMDAAEASWNLKVLSKTPPSPKFLGSTNSDLAFTGNYVIQGNYNGYQIWDISNPSTPVAQDRQLLPGVAERRLRLQEPAVRVGRGQHGPHRLRRQGVKDTVSTDRIRGVRIFDITDITHPKNVANVQTCRGSHTHTVLRRSEGQGQRLRLRLGFGRRPLVGRAGGLLERDARERSEQRASSASKSSRCRSRIRSRRRSSARRASSTISRRRSVTARRRKTSRRPRRPSKPASARGALHHDHLRQRAGSPRRLREAAARQRRQGSQRHGRGDRRRQRGAPRGAARHHCEDVRRRHRAVRRAGRRSATTSPCIRRSVTPAARARATASCSTSRTRRLPFASAPSPTRTSPTGTRPRSTTTAPRCCSPMSGAAVARRSAARPTRRSGAPTRSSRSRTARCSSRATTSCPLRRRTWRTASRTTVRSSRSRAAT